MSNPAEAKAELYNSLGLELTFDAGQKVVNVEAAPVYSGSCRRGVVSEGRADL